jgi:photolyase PhrII
MSLIDDLPAHLHERTRALNAAPCRSGGEFVLLWLHHAVRGHENPALDVALHMAAWLRRPVLAYQGLGAGHRFDSDRSHRFILEGARDAAAELAQLGVRHVFWLPMTEGESGAGTASAHSPLPALVARACVVVTDDVPAPPWPRWSARLAGRSPVAMLAVDSACIVPMALSAQRPERAFAFRQRFAAEFLRRIGPPPASAPAAPGPFAGVLGFEPFDLAGDLDAAIAGCAIDHAIAPVAHSVGGSVAGYARWRRFRDEGLARYHRQRNDAALPWPLGVSRLSPYLHHGHVAATRIAREAAQAGGAGVDKFFDELWVWRELAWHWCAHTADPESLAALPEWAQATLADHARDPRPAWRPADVLAAGASGEPLWDLAQRSLLRHGELHNNLRMTWGKALLAWSASPAQALARLVDLNHRYALDGNDPASYGGLLWCLGLFDRPFTPPRTVIGSVRPRPLAAHARRLDMTTYAARVERPASGTPLQVAVIGAGMAGAACARALHDAGHRVRVLEKSRGPGGRMACRRADPERFDHGAQYITARDARFRRQLSHWREAGVVARWAPAERRLEADGSLRVRPAQGARWIGAPGMNAPVARLLDGIELRCGAAVAALEHDGRGWRLLADDGSVLARCDALVVSAPAPQAAVLLAERTPAIAQRLRAVRYAPCWSAMLSLDRPVPFDSLAADGAPLAWAASMASRAGRPTAPAWVVHAGPDWSRAHLEAQPAQVAERLAGAFAAACALPVSAVTGAIAHRWRHALCETPLGPPALFDPTLQVAVVGDACLGGRVEAAWLSGQAGAGHLLRAAAARARGDGSSA